MKRLLSKIKKNWIMVWLVLAATALCSMVVYARYSNEHNIVKRVVATDKDLANRFTSNYLSTGTIMLKTQTVPVDSTDDPEIEISIWNYNHKNPTKYYKSDINYTLDMVFTNTEGTALTSSQVENLIGNDEVEIYKITKNADQTVSETLLVKISKDSISGTFNEVIKAQKNIGTENKYKLVLPNSSVGKDIAVKVTATPGSEYHDLPGAIAAMFNAESQTIILGKGWMGSINDDENIPLSKYEGFNYSITGSGASSGTLKWRKDLIELNKDEIEELFSIDVNDSSNYSDDGNFRTIELSSLSSADNAGRYDFQFYIKNKAAKTAISGMTWSDFKKIIVFKEND
ncbi:hypothetical protein [Eubacterium xylanophilum]|uniref:hypothetical protein n=1 Tax=Eubacterium xylanophilum TaxID=39497 RepID=UPI000479F29E|nr:hypothetical protein [Eubacterium xylanophilum]